MLAKVSLNAPAGKQHFELAHGQRCILGRAAGCDVLIDDASVSRRHCSVQLKREVLVVTDLQSAHGLTRDNQRTTQCELEVGDTVRLGLVELCFEALLESDAAELAGDAGANAGGSPQPARPAASPSSSGDGGGGAAVPAKGAADPLVGQVLGNYRILELLGAGGYATVYRAEQVQLAREVALKVLRQPPEGAQVEALATFQREARAAANLADPRLVHVIDFGQDRGLHYLSMELVRGGSLAQRLRKDGPVGWRELLPILRDIAGALQVAHGAGLVHRDVKPANVLLTGGGRAKLADLGLVRSMGGAGELVGTAAFMAPEQLQQAPVDGRSDLYSLGCTAYAALAGKPPFVGTKKEILRAQRLEDPDEFADDLEVPPAIDRLVRLELLAKDPADRPADAAAVLAALEAIEARADVLGLPRRPVRSSLKRPAARAGGGLGVLLLSLLLLAGAAALWYWHTNRPV